MALPIPVSPMEVHDACSGVSRNRAHRSVLDRFSHPTGFAAQSKVCRSCGNLIATKLGCFGSGLDRGHNGLTAFQ